MTSLPSPRHGRRLIIVLLLVPPIYLLALTAALFLLFMASIGVLYIPSWIVRIAVSLFEEDDVAQKFQMWWALSISSLFSLIIGLIWIGQAKKVSLLVMSWIGLFLLLLKFRPDHFWVFTGCCLIATAIWIRLTSWASPYLPSSK